MTSYAAEHASALADIAEAGAPVTFSAGDPGTYDPAAGTWSVPDASSVVGYAVETRGDPQAYERLELIAGDPITLLFAPSTFGGVPALGSSVAWAGSTYTVRAVEPLRPDGTAILANVIAAR